MDRMILPAIYSHAESHQSSVVSRIHPAQAKEQSIQYHNLHSTPLHSTPLHSTPLVSTNRMHSVPLPQSPPYYLLAHENGTADTLVSSRLVSSRLGELPAWTVASGHRQACTNRTTRLDPLTARGRSDERTNDGRNAAHPGALATGTGQVAHGHAHRLAGWLDRLPAGSLAHWIIGSLDDSMTR